MKRKKLKKLVALFAAAAMTASFAAYVHADDPVTYSTYITVVNADTNAVLDGAQVNRLVTAEGTTTTEPVGTGTTDVSGQVSGSFEAGDIKITASKSGFTDATETFNVEAYDGNFFEIKLVPTRFGVWMPSVFAESENPDDPDNPVTESADVKLLVRRTSDTEAKAWNEGESAIELASGASASLPEGEYIITNASTGYTQNVEMKINVDASGTVTYYDTDGTTVLATSTDAGGTVTYANAAGDPITLTDFQVLYKMTVTKLDDPTYIVELDDAGVDATSGLQTYTAKISLKNIAATYGTFGLKYDTTVLDFDPTTGITMGTDVVQKMTPHVAYADAMNAAAAAASTTWPGWEDSCGYYAFVWQAGDYGDTPTNDDVLDTTLGAKEIATLTFTLASTATIADVNSSSFSVMRWQSTKEATTDAAAMSAAYPSDADLDPLTYYNEYWRDIDDDNDPALNPSGLPQGRLENTKASTFTDTAAEYKGFFQAAVSGTLAETTPARFYDVKTVFESNLAENVYTGTIKAFNPRSDKPVTVRAYRVGDTTAIMGTATLTKINADGSVEYSYTLTLADTDGFILEISKPEHLTYTRDISAITSPHDVELLCGDCNNDGFIKIPDRAYLVNYFNQSRAWTNSASPADANFNRADLNGDARVNFFDLNILKKNLNKKYV